MNPTAASLWSKLVSSSRKQTSSRFALSVLKTVIRYLRWGSSPAARLLLFQTFTVLTLSPDSFKSKPAFPLGRIRGAATPTYFTVSETFDVSLAATARHDPVRSEMWSRHHGPGTSSGKCSRGCSQADLTSSTFLGTFRSRDHSTNWAYFCGGCIV